MAIVLKNVQQNKNKDFIIDSNIIIGIMGDYLSFIKLFNENSLFFISKDNVFKEKNVYEEIKRIYPKSDLDEKLVLALPILELKKDFLQKKIKDLSNGEKRLIEYIKMLIVDTKIIVIDNAFQYLDYYYKKKIINLLKSLVRNNKTIMISGNNSDDIYLVCQKLILVNEDSITYNDATKLFANNRLLKKYGIMKPTIIKFVDLCHKKGKRIHYTNDIRDLIKEVYKNV